MDGLVNVESNERRVEDKGRPLTGEEEDGREEGVGDHFWEDELDHTQHTHTFSIAFSSSTWGGRGRGESKEEGRKGGEGGCTWLSLLQRSMGLT
jgi:hypothetical protein